MKLRMAMKIMRRNLGRHTYDWQVDNGYRLGRAFDRVCKAADRGLMSGRSAYWRRIYPEPTASSPDSTSHKQR